MTQMKFLTMLAILLLPVSASQAQDTATFKPGMYATESVNSKFPDQPVKADVCVTSANFEAFRDETLEQYRKSPQFNAACKLGEVEGTADGFRFSMACDGANHKLDFKFAKDDTVTQIIETEIVQMPEMSSTATTIMRRTGDCAS